MYTIPYYFTLYEKVKAIWIYSVLNLEYELCDVEKNTRISIY